MAKFEIKFNSQNGYWARFVSDNGEIVWNTEGYTTKQNAEKAIAFLKMHASTSNISN